jgi:putative redox protein
MADAKPPMVVDLAWDGRLLFTARQGGHAWVVDGDNEAGPSPVALLASALAGCLSVDLVHILKKGRFDVRSCGARLIGHRAGSEPRRFTAIDLRFEIETNAPREQVDRAIALSHEKYCSVWHSMRQDIDLTTSVLITGSESDLTPDGEGQTRI